MGLEMTRLEQTARAFRAAPTNQSAGEYMESVLHGMGAGDSIDDDRGLDALAEINYWLLFDRLMIELKESA